ncbi:MAG TPA: hypothetical protein VJP89_19740 [Pyrinomonadaceae bacterium]|nr:hypothetical protein [Pyrinomonadaceae bacterium]
MAIQVLINQVGPLPITGTFNAIGDSPMYIEVNGSVWTQTANVMTGIDIAIDGQQVATAHIFSNASSTHRAVVPAYIPVKLSQGPHKITLSTSANTVSDFNDYYTAVIHY